MLEEPTDQFWGVRDCAFRDPSGDLVRIAAGLRAVYVAGMILTVFRGVTALISASGKLTRQEAIVEILDHVRVGDSPSPFAVLSGLTVVATAAAIIRAPTLWPVVS